MTVETTNTYSGPFTPNGATTVFPFTFKALSDAEVAVLALEDGEWSTVSDSLYDVDLNAGAGGNVTFTSAPAAGPELYIFSEPLFTQSSTFANQGAFSPTVLNLLHDRAALRDQWLKERVTATFPEGARFPADRAGKFLAYDAEGLPVVSSGTGADDGLRDDLADVAAGAALINYRGRTLATRAGDVISVKDEGAAGDGTTQDSTDFAAAVTSLTTGGGLDIPGGTYLVGQQFFGPSRGNVHNYDVAIPTGPDLLTNGTFAGSPATGWTLSQMSSSNPGVAHIAGLSASAKRNVTLQAATNHIIRITLTTTTAGGITFYVNGEALLGAVDYFGVPVGTNVTYRFPYLNTGATGSVELEFRSDTVWAGSISLIEVIQVTRETPYDFISISADNKVFTNPFGMKFGKYLSGNISLGDRATGALQSSSSAWNVLLGSRCGSVITDQIEITAVGSLALEYNQASQLTAVGYSALRCNTTGIGSVAVGFKALGLNTTGSRCTGIGYFASFAKAMGNDNTGGGYQALYQDQKGSFNSAWGSQAGLQMKDGSLDTYIGAQAGPTNVNTNITYTYSSQTLIGAQTKGYGNGNTAVGAAATCGTDPNAAGTEVTNSSAFGAGAATTKNNQVVIGNASVVETVLRGVVRGTTYTVATLPSAVTMGAGARSFVTDANATTFAANVAGGGANGVPVYSDGTNWKIG